MDTRTGEIVQDLEAVPEAERKNYIPLTQAMAKRLLKLSAALRRSVMLFQMTEDQRDAWFNERPYDRDCSMKAMQKRTRKLLAKGEST